MGHKFKQRGKPHSSLKVPKVDGIKQLRDGGPGGDSSGTSKSGDWPLRMRGYYRALKRSEPWAVKLSKLSPLVFLLRWTYRPHLMEEVLYSKNPFLSLISKDEGNSFSGKYFPVPMVFGVTYGK